MLPHEPLAYILNFIFYKKALLKDLGESRMRFDDSLACILNRIVFKAQKADRDEIKCLFCP